LSKVKNNPLPHLYPPPPKGRGRIKEGEGKFLLPTSYFLLHPLGGGGIWNLEFGIWNLGFR